MIIYSFGDASDEKIKEFQRLVDFEFSDRYIDFMRKTNGGIVGEKDAPEIEISSTGEVVRISMFYGISEDDRDIITINRKYFEQLPENSVIIAESDMDGYFVVYNDDGINTLCYWDEQKRLSVTSEEGNAYFITNSPDEFWDALGEIEIKNLKDEYENEEKLEGDYTMERINYIPLGSIVLLEGGIQKLLVTSRGLIVNNAGQEVIFDYAGVLYPQGLISDQIVYFNHKDIAKVVFEGYKDEEDEITVNNINKYVAEHPDLERGSVENWKA